MPVWGTVLLTVLGGWLLLSVLVALAVGRAIRIGDRRSPRKPLARPRKSHLRAVPRADRDADADADGRRGRRRQPRG
jgi:hypothetical protein